MMMNTCDGRKEAPIVRPATQANRFYKLPGTAQRKAGVR